MLQRENRRHYEIMSKFEARHMGRELKCTRVMYKNAIYSRQSSFDMPMAL